MHDYPIKACDLVAAKEEYADREPRGLFYLAATALVELAIGGKPPPLKTAEALAVLLQTWNKAYYQYRPFNAQHLSEIERILEEHQPTLTALRERSIEVFTSDDEAMVKKVFGDFEKVLGAVGAAKSLHLLAPRFFPIWDGEIAKKHHLPLRIPNAERYCQFMVIAREQVKSLGGEKGIGRNVLKAIDEYNYCKYSLKKKRARKRLA
jgi:hypothetical protein